MAGTKTTTQNCPNNPLAGKCLTDQVTVAVPVDKMDAYRYPLMITGAVIIIGGTIFFINPKLLLPRNK
jgi:hypothetical protein